MKRARIGMGICISVAKWGVFLFPGFSLATADE